MSELDDPIPLCDECGDHPAKGPVHHTPTDEEHECEWCGATIRGHGAVFVERQEDPGPPKWKQERGSLVEYLGELEHIYSVRPNSRVVDFTVGDPTLWPQPLEDNHINVVPQSSVSFGFIADGTADSIKLHLPPTREELQESIGGELDLPDGVVIHHGTEARGVVTPAPDGIVTPHIIGKDVDIALVEDVVEQLVDVYTTVYGEGNEVLQVVP